MAFYIDLPIRIRSWRNNYGPSNRSKNVSRHSYDINAVHANYRMDNRLWTWNKTVSNFENWGTDDWSTTLKQVNTPPDFLYIIKCFIESFGNGQISLKVKNGSINFFSYLIL